MLNFVYCFLIVMIEWSNITWPEAEKAAKESRIAILPMGAVEAHALHLPLCTDVFAAEAIAKEVAKRLDAVLLPTISYTYIQALRKYPGSVSIRSDTLKALVKDICRSLCKQGIKKIAIINHHIPNEPILRIASEELDGELGIKVLYIMAPFSHIYEKVCESKRWHGWIVHSEEVETSEMLFLRPDLVKMDKAVKDYPPVPPDIDHFAVDWRTFSKSGGLGDPTVATKEKGRQILEIAVNYCVDIIEKAFK